MLKNKIGGNQRECRKFHMEQLIGKEVEAVFLIGDPSENQRQILITDILERRDNPLAHSGYYLRNSNVQITLKSSKCDGYTEVGTVPRILVKPDSYIEKQLRENNLF